MRRSIFSASATILSLILFLALFGAPAAAQDAPDLVIDVQPRALAMFDEKGGTVSVHTNVPWNDFDPWTTATLGTLNAYLVKQDLSGNVVAKFNLAAVMDMVEDGASSLSVPFVLEGDGYSDSATATFIVASTSGKKQGGRTPDEPE